MELLGGWQLDRRVPTGFTGVDPVEGRKSPGSESKEHRSSPGEKMKAIQIVTVPEQALFCTGDASKYLGISPNTLRKRADLGLIPCRQDENKNRVFLLEDLDDYRKALPPYQHTGNPFTNRPVKTGREKGGTT